ncbi:unnamed protein product [Mytilus edulis]|uniref:Uncharacterized protein n=1 Tax=Mytilus edulis TaxID=6550 RepID=A0A8S3RS16_MYTED|nr:unnamed protein product [Mytilus edulis]
MAGNFNTFEEDSISKWSNSQMNRFLEEMPGFGEEERVESSPIHFGTTFHPKVSTGKGFYEHRMFDGESSSSSSALKDGKNKKRGKRRRKMEKKRKRIRKRYLSFWRSPEMEKKSFLTDLETKKCCFATIRYGNFFVNIYDNRPIAFEEAVQFSELVSQLEMLKENFKVENKTTSNPTEASGSTTFNPEPFVSPTYKPELYIPSSRGSAEMPPPPPYTAPKKKKQKTLTLVENKTTSNPTDASGSTTFNPEPFVSQPISQNFIFHLQGISRNASPPPYTAPKKKSRRRLPW